MGVPCFMRGEMVKPRKPRLTLLTSGAVYSRDGRGYVGYIKNGKFTSVFAGFGSL